MNDAVRRAERAEAFALRELAAVPSWIWDGKSLPVPIESIAEDHYGVVVEARPSLEEFATTVDVHVSGVLLRAHGRILVDALEAARAPGRRRFTIAHELGHLVLHDDRAGPRIGRLMPSPRGKRARQPTGLVYPAALAYRPEELEANQFAAATLMPARNLTGSLTECPITVAELCGVSVAAAEKRLEYLYWRRSTHGTMPRTSSGASGEPRSTARCAAEQSTDAADASSTVDQSSATQLRTGGAPCDIPLHQ